PYGRDQRKPRLVRPFSESLHKCGTRIACSHKQVSANECNQADDKNSEAHGFSPSICFCSRGDGPARRKRPQRRGKLTSMKKMLAIAGLGLLLAATPAGAQDWPDWSVKLTVPFAAGSTPDIVGRLPAERLPPNS